MCRRFNESFNSVSDGTVYRDETHQANFVLSHRVDGGYVCQGCYGYAEVYAAPEFSENPDQDGFYVCGPMCMDTILQEQRYALDKNQGELLYA